MYQIPTFFFLAKNDLGNFLKSMLTVFVNPPLQRFHEFSFGSNYTYTSKREIYICKCCNLFNKQNVFCTSVIVVNISRATSKDRQALLTCNGLCLSLLLGDFSPLVCCCNRSCLAAWRACCCCRCSSSTVLTSELVSPLGLPSLLPASNWLPRVLIPF